ncbi:MAG: SurA N-terminal domain-containing protein [Nitrospirota bacterium]
MLKIVREWTVEKPWLLRIIIGALAITFVISLAWVGDQANDHVEVVAEVGEEKISIQEYRRVYKNMSRFYRKLLKDQFDEKGFPKQVIDLMVEDRLWIQEANRMGLQATDSELQESILKMPSFQKDGKFNSEFYKRILASERLTAEKFEEQQRQELIVGKAKKIIGQAAALTPSEILEIETTKPADLVREKESRLSQKRDKALRAYTLAMKKKAAIFINEELL